MTSLRLDILMEVFAEIILGAQDTLIRPILLYHTLLKRFRT